MEFIQTMENIRVFLVDKIFSGEINYDNNGLFRFITLVVGFAMGLLVVTNWVPRFFKMLIRKFGLLTTNKQDKYKRHAKEYIDIRASASMYFRIFSIPTVVMTLAILGFLTSTNVIALQLPFAIPNEILFAISFILIILCFIAFCILQYIFTFTDLPDSVIPTFNDFLPPEYHTVTTTYYVSSGEGYHVGGSESHTYDANFEANMATGIGNFFSLLYSILTFLFSAIFKYFDSVLLIIYNLLILPFRRLHLATVQKIYDSEMEYLCSAKYPLDLYRGQNIYLDSDFYNIDAYVDFKYVKHYYTKAKEQIESKKDKNVIIYKKEGFIWANTLTKFICEYKKQNSVCYIYEALKGIVQFEIFNNPKPIYGKKELEWVKETIVPINMPSPLYKYYNARDIEVAQYYYFNQILSNDANLNKNVKVVIEENNTLTVKKCKLKQIQLNKNSKSFIIEN